MKTFKCMKARKSCSRSRRQLLATFVSRNCDCELWLMVLASKRDLVSVKVDQLVEHTVGQVRVGTFTWKRRKREAAATKYTENKQVTSRRGDVCMCVVSVRTRAAHRDATSDTPTQARYANTRSATLHRRPSSLTYARRIPIAILNECPK